MTYFPASHPPSIGDRVLRWPARVRGRRVSPPPSFRSTIFPMASPLFDFSHLTSAEREQLANELWESLADEPQASPLTDAQAEELDRRLAAYRDDPSSAIPWRQALSEIENNGE